MSPNSPHRFRVVCGRWDSAVPPQSLVDIPPGFEGGADYGIHEPPMSRAEALEECAERNRESIDDAGSLIEIEWWAVVQRGAAAIPDESYINCHVWADGGFSREAEYTERCLSLVNPLDDEHQRFPLPSGVC